MTATTLPVLLVTANVGSIFEEPTEMLGVWCKEFLSIVDKLEPKFLALHCQEVGGKNYENSMKHVEHFVKLLKESDELRLFDKIRVFLDEDYSSAENFTALGNLYFIHQSIKDVLLWNFKDCQFEAVEGEEIYSGNIEAVVTKEKAKFPQDFFPECKWSRKGFLRTRWSIEGTIFDLVNIHLFHDASNFIAMESYPSVYCKNRRRALEHTLQRFHNDRYDKAPFFVFGDFNFRTDTESVIKKLTEGLTSNRSQNNKNNDHTKLQYEDEDNKAILTVGKKEFNHFNHQDVFLTPTWLISFDRELEAFDKYLTEYPITFPPSYPFEEKLSHGKCYMQTRCPAWCDRVLLSHTAKRLIQEDGKLEYGLIGLETCMGDHKPVYLRVDVKENSGIIECCNHAPYQCLPGTCDCCQSFASVTISIVDMSDYMTTNSNSYQTIDSKLLHEPITRDMLSHEPYTPESAESHSPTIPIDRTRSKSVSPTQLKLLLENVLKGVAHNRPIRRAASANVNITTPKTEQFRTRTMSEIPKSSNCRLTKSLINRWESHHSSSDEDWFEFTRNNPSDAQRKNNESDNGLDVREEENKNVTHKKSKWCCCIA